MSIAEHLETLREQNSHINHLQKSIDKPLELRLAETEDTLVLISPISANSSMPLEEELKKGIYFTLEEQDGLLTEFGGYAAYLISKEHTDRVPSRIFVPVGDYLAFNFRVLDTDLFLSSEQLPKVHIPKVKKGDRFVANLDTYSTFRFNLIPTRVDIRDKFPGYGVPFQLQYDDQSIVTYVTASSKARMGELKGWYISRNIKQLFNDHPELEQTKRITVEVVSPGRVYRVVDYGKP